VSFYEGNPAVHGARLLQTVFVTPLLAAGTCISYVHTITTPGPNFLYAVVNDSGKVGTTGPAPIFPETDITNNIAHAADFMRFNVRVVPNDTTIERTTSATLFAVADGGTLRLPVWQSNPFLSCTNCFNPIVTPTYTHRYMVTGQNENQCTDTGWVTVRTVTSGEVYIPSGFTPNQDGLNDVLYVMANGNIKILKDFYVYSRYGEKIFEVHNVAPNDPLYGWKGFIKGKPAPSGAYVYQVLAEFTDGKTKYYKGAVTLIR
jgi:gliding motility-associated-like protein